MIFHMISFLFQTLPTEHTVIWFYFLAIKGKDMRLDNIKHVSVIGAGRMGSQISELLSRLGGYPVILWDLEDELLQRGLSSIRARLEKHLLKKEKISRDEYEKILGRIETTTELFHAAYRADFVVEAVVENLQVKKGIFQRLDEHAPAHAVLASNTSALNITEIGSLTKRRDRVVGMHFFNPVAVMKLVEVVRGPLTSEDTVNVTCALAKRLGKEPVVCKDFSFGFIANRAYRAMRDEALQMVWERVASPEDIDKAMKLGYALPVGPLELGDMVGSWEIAVASEDSIVKETGKRLHPLIKMMVRAGYPGGPGRKGIYDFWKEVFSKW